MSGDRTSTGPSHVSMESQYMHRACQASAQWATSCRPLVCQPGITAAIHKRGARAERRTRPLDRPLTAPLHRPCPAARS
eukprot:scaffold5382_cov405-Prasinococcus_capsulatus_cf.AAC.3